MASSWLQAVPSVCHSVVHADFSAASCLLAMPDHLPAMHHLLKNGANPHLKNKRKMSPLELAQKMKKDYDTMQVFEKDYGWKHDDTGVAHTEL